MNAVIIDVVALVGKHVEINRAGHRVNNRRARDAHFRDQIVISSVTIAKIAVGHHGGNAQIGAPKQSAGRPTVAVGVKRINTVVFRGHIDHVMHPFARNGHIGHDQRLRIDMPVHRVGKNPAETAHIDVSRCQQGLVCVRPDTGVVIVVRQHGHQRHRRIGGQRGEGLGGRGPGGADTVRSRSGEEINRVGGQTRNRRRKSPRLLPQGNDVRPTRGIGAAITRSIIKGDGW